MTATNLSAMPFEIEATCDEDEARFRRFRVVRLDLSGAATMGRFDPFTTDHGFLVAYPLDEFGPRCGQFRDLRQHLGWPMRAKVDLVSLDNFRSPAVRAGTE